MCEAKILRFPAHLTREQHVTPAEFLQRHPVKCFYHFTDVRNLPLIRSAGGLWCMAEMRRQGISPPAAGGDAASQLSDSQKGMDQYVHLCFCDQHPMEYRARQDGRIGESVFLHVDVSVLDIPGIQFTSGMANGSAVLPVGLTEAAAFPDLPAVYTRLDWKNPDELEKVLRARKYELLVPRFLPIQYLKNFPNG